MNDKDEIQTISSLFLWFTLGTHVVFIGDILFVEAINYQLVTFYFAKACIFVSVKND